VPERSCYQRGIPCQTILKQIPNNFLTIFDYTAICILHKPGNAGKATMIQKQKKTTAASRTKLNLTLDIGLALLFVLSMEVYFTGLPLHELLGLFFAAGIVIHLLLHWKWIVTLTRTFFKKLLHESRFNYVLNTALAVAVITLIASGIVISETLGLNLALEDSTNLFWLTGHVLSAQLIILLIAVHIAMHWKWILANSKKYLFRSPAKPKTRTVGTPLGGHALKEHSHE
jgi:hypothetical protein